MLGTKGFGDVRVPILDGRRILVSGAAGGLGAALCVHLAKQGATLLATDVSSAKGEQLRSELRWAGLPSERLHYVQLDQSRADVVTSTLGLALEQFGRPDTVINNAAIYPRVAADDLTHEKFELVQSVNVGGAVAMVQVCLPGMREAGFGRIINIASITFDTGHRDLSAYVAAKGALIGLTRVWAREFGPSGITVNAVSPGAFPTDAERIHGDAAAYNQFVLDQQAVKRRGTAHDFAALVSFLVGPDAGFITGQTIRVDGGWMMA